MDRGVSSPLPSRLLINWGCSKLPVPTTAGQVVLNQPAAVQLATDKLATFKRFKEAQIRHPVWWTDAEAVDRRGIVLARTKLRASGGDGIVVCREDGQLPAAPLYTKYIRKNAEYRLHVLRDTVLVIQQKRRDSEAEQTADQKLIRNHANGWVFAVNDVSFINEDQRKQCEQLAVSAVKSLGLDFGAVDLVVSAKEGLPYVLEINTAPGIESPTLLAAYTAGFNKLKDEYRHVLQLPKAAELHGARPAGIRNRTRS